MYTISRLMLILTLAGIVCSMYLLAVQVGGLAYILIGVVVIGVLAKRGHGALTAFGTGRFATRYELRKAGLLGARTGLILGRLTGDGKLPLSTALRGLLNPAVPAKEACEEFLASVRTGRGTAINPALVRLPNAVHTAVFAPTGVGKGVSCVIPFLQTSAEGAVVVDFKGENARLTAEHRRRRFGHRIVMLDPYKVVTQKPDTLNVIDKIDADSPTAIDECRSMAEAIIIPTGQEHDRHWLDSAELWLTALIALVAKYGERNDRSLQTVRTLLTNPQKLEMAIKLMCASDAWDGMLARMGGQLTQYKDKELGGVLTTTNRFLKFLDTQIIAASTKTSSFDPADLLKGKITVYLILPAEHMRTQSPLLRLWISSLLRAVVRGGLQEKKKVHFVLDEAASLGHMQALEDAVGLARGYGVRLYFFYQAVGQLRKCWPDGQDQTFQSNVTQVFFGTNDMPTAEYVSNRLGEETIIVTSGGTSTGSSWQIGNNSSSTSSSRNQNDNWSQVGRKLQKPEEILALPKETAITFTPGVRPICTTLVRYYEERNLARQNGMWAGFKAALQVFTVSLALMVAAGTLVKALALNGQGKVLNGQGKVTTTQSSTSDGVWNF